FSQDGKRIYFNRLVSPNRAIAGFVDISSVCGE
ncbi:MAG: hypothetical protein K0Q90_3839, partial [Paenibacillaceae bacterium]|nr:hypothetical protein [Paenibacillaceae bacterium]